MIHYNRYLFVKKKVFNYSELHFSKVTSYKIHTLGLVLMPLLSTYNTALCKHTLVCRIKISTNCPFQDFEESG